MITIAATVKYSFVVSIYSPSIVWLFFAFLVAMPKVFPVIATYVLQFAIASFVVIVRIKITGMAE